MKKKNIKEESQVIGLKPVTTHVCFIVDRSFSMARLAPHYVKLYNDQIADHQAKAVGKVTGSLVFFNHEVQESFIGQPINYLAPITVQQFAANGNTALRDAVGRTIQSLKTLDKKDENIQFLVVVISDGEENCSKIWTSSMLKETIEGLEATERWSFQYFGCNQQALTETGTIGLSKTISYQEDDAGINMMGMAMCHSNSKLYNYRASGQTLKAEAYVTPEEMKKVLDNTNVQ